MRVLVLSPNPLPLESIFEWCGDTMLCEEGELTGLPNVDFIVSYRYRHILKGEILEVFKDKIINLHISLLPWNRGADPNFWSWFDDTPKGVTIHRIDAGIDTGDILLQKEMKFDPAHTLQSTYDILQTEMIKLFNAAWPIIRIGRMPGRKQDIGGSYHNSADKDPFWKLLPKGFDTPVDEVRSLGDEVNGERQVTAAFFDRMRTEI